MSKKNDILNIFKSDRFAINLIKDYDDNIDLYPFSGEVNSKFNEDENGNYNAFSYFTVPLLYLYPYRYVINVLKYITINEYTHDGKKYTYKQADYSKCTKNTIKEFNDYCKKMYDSIKPKIEQLLDFVELKMESYNSSFEDFCDDRDVPLLYLKIKDEYTSKLLNLDESVDIKIQRLIDKIPEKNKDLMKRSYTNVIEYILKPKTIDKRSSITFADILAVCKMVNINNSKLYNLLSKGNYKEISANDFSKDDYQYYKNRFGDKFKICEDLNTDGGDYVVLAKSKLWYINFEHDDCEDISRYPYDTNNFTDYIYTDNSIVKAILREYDYNKKYYLISDPPKGSKPIIH